MLSWVQSLSHVQLFVTPWSTASQASLSITSSGSLPKLMSIESVIPSNHLILSHPFLLLPSIFPSIKGLFKWVSSLHQVAKVLDFPLQHQSFPASGSFPMSQFFVTGGQSIGASASASVLPMNIQDWLPLGLTDVISLLSKGLSRVFSNTTVQKHPFFGAQLSLISTQG